MRLALLGAMLLALIAGRLNYGVLQGVCHTSARTIAMIFFIIVSATCFAYVYRALGGDDSSNISFMELASILGVLVPADGHCLHSGLLPRLDRNYADRAAGVCTDGCGLDFGDHVAKEDVVIWFTILMAINLQTSFLTPPFGFALFYLKGIAPKEVKIQSIYFGIIPFVILQVVALIVVINYPQAALWLVHLD